MELNILASMEGSGALVTNISDLVSARPREVIDSVWSGFGFGATEEAPPTTTATGTMECFRSREVET